MIDTDQIAGPAAVGGGPGQFLQLGLGAHPVDLGSGLRQVATIWWIGGASA